MNILIFSYKFYPDYGGIETHSEMLATYFSKRGNNVKVLTTSQPPKIGNVKDFAFEVIYRPTKKIFGKLSNGLTWFLRITPRYLCLGQCYLVQKSIL